MSSLGAGDTVTILHGGYGAEHVIGVPMKIERRHCNTAELSRVDGQPLCMEAIPGSPREVPLSYLFRLEGRGLCEYLSMRALEDAA